MDLYSLPAVTALSDSVTIVEHQALKIVRIISPKARAAIALHGAHTHTHTHPSGFAQQKTDKHDFTENSTHAADN